MSINYRCSILKAYSGSILLAAGGKHLYVYRSAYTLSLLARVKVRVCMPTSLCKA